jgi:hypothetical protein
MKSTHLLMYGFVLFYISATSVACTPFKKPASTEITVIKVDLLNKPKKPIINVVEKSPIPLQSGMSQTVPIRQDTPPPPNELTGIYDTGQFMSPPVSSELSTSEIRFQPVPEDDFNADTHTNIDMDTIN